MNEIQIHAIAQVLSDYTLVVLKFIGIACFLFLSGFFSGMFVGRNLK